MIPRITIENPAIPGDDWRDHMLPDTDKTHPEYWDEYIEVDVLTVHFQKNTMRVRRVGTVSVWDMPADQFFSQVSLKATVDI